MRNLILTALLFVLPLETALSNEPVTDSEIIKESSFKDYALDKGVNIKIPKNWIVENEHTNNIDAILSNALSFDSDPEFSEEILIKAFNPYLGTTVRISVQKPAHGNELVKSFRTSSVEELKDFVMGIKEKVEGSQEGKSNMKNFILVSMKRPAAIKLNDYDAAFVEYAFANNSQSTTNLTVKIYTVQKDDLDYVFCLSNTADMIEVSEPVMNYIFKSISF